MFRFPFLRFLYSPEGEPGVTPPAPQPGPTPAPQPNNDPEGPTIPKYRFDEVNQRCQAAEAEVTRLKAELEKFKGKDERIAALEKELKDTKDGYELEKANATRQQAVEKAISDSTVDMEVMMKLLDLSKVTIDDQGKISGLDEQIKALRASKPYLFKAPKPVVKPGANPPGDTKSFAQSLAEKKVREHDIVKKAKTYF